MIISGLSSLTLQRVEMAGVGGDDLGLCSPQISLCCVYTCMWSMKMESQHRGGGEFISCCFWGSWETDF